jgi:CheY-like chemotaxis protein
MNVTHALAPHLPYLRRYARALTGSQESGDAYVRAALTALLAGEQVLDSELSPRVALYKLFHQIWSSPASHYDASVLPGEDNSTRVLIIEDEPIIALDLENLVSELGHEVVGTAATRDQAVKLALSARPGLILADINLGEGGSGIDAVSEILDSFDIPVIFVTAYPEKLLTGERPEPTYLIAKPFLPETVQATVGQALFFHPIKRKAA